MQTQQLCWTASTRCRVTVLGIAKSLQTGQRYRTFLSFFLGFCLFVGLFVGIEPEKLLWYFAFCVGRKINPWEWSHTGRGTNHECTKDSGTYHVLVNLWLTLYVSTTLITGLSTLGQQTFFVLFTTKNNQEITKERDPFQRSRGHTDSFSHMRTA